MTEPRYDGRVAVVTGARHGLGRQHALDLTAEAVCDTWTAIDADGTHRVPTGVLDQMMPLIQRGTPENAALLTAAFEAFDADEDAAVAVLHGRGGTFLRGRRPQGRHARRGGRRGSRPGARREAVEDG